MGESNKDIWCDVKTEKKSVKQEGALALTQETTYVTYSTCTEGVLAEYTIPEFTGFGFVMGLLVLMAIAVVILAAAETHLGRLGRLLNTAEK